MNDSIVAEILQTLNRIETKVDSNHKELADHIATESLDFREIRKDISDTKNESEQRHAALIQSIDSYMDKSTKMENAFLKTHEGILDYSGHYQDHHSRRRIGDWMAEARSKTALKLIEYFSLAFALWLLYTVWEAFIKGPQK
jgi:predicted transcriptional regulator